MARKCRVWSIRTRKNLNKQDWNYYDKTIYLQIKRNFSWSIHIIKLIVKYNTKGKSTFFFQKCFIFSHFQRILKFKNSQRNCCLFAPSGFSYNQYVKSFTLRSYNQYVNTHQDLQHCQNFLYRHFDKTEYYVIMQ